MKTANPFFLHLLLMVFGVAVAVCGGLQLNFIQANLLSESVYANSVARPAQEAVVDYSLICPITAQDKINYGFETVADHITLNLLPGEKFSIPLQLKNTGYTAWCGDKTYAKIGDLNNDYYLRLSTEDDLVSPIFNDNRISLNTDGVVYSGETGTFVLEGTAPLAKGIYREKLHPVVEGLTHFNDLQVTVDFAVEATPEDYQKLEMLKGRGSTVGFELSDPLRVIVNLNEPKMYVYKGQQLLHEFIVSPGAWDTPTPVGVYSIYNKQELRIGSKYPHYRMPQWVGLKDQYGRFRGYGLHALPYLGEKRENSYFWKEAVSHLGTFVSHGCVRMGDDNAVWLWNLIDPENTTVQIVKGLENVTI